MTIESELIEVLGPAIAAGLMISLTHAPLGIEVLKRGIIFIDLAVAQIAGLGLVAGSLLFHDSSGWILQLTALGLAISAGLFFRKVETTIPKYQEAIIGCGFVLSASIALLLLADHPHGGEEVRYMLSGQILFVTWSDILKHAPIYAVILAIWFLRPQTRTNIGFYLLFSLAITSSVQLVGVYIVFASLILPALAAAGAKRPHLTAWICGIASVLSGVALALKLDLPAGPVIVVSYAVVAMIIQATRKRKSRIET